METNQKRAVCAIGYSDQNMIDLHFRPHEARVGFDHDNELNGIALEWIAGLHGIDASRLSFESAYDDLTDVMCRDDSGQVFRIGEVSFLIEGA